MDFTEDGIKLYELLYQDGTQSSNWTSHREATAPTFTGQQTCIPISTLMQPKMDIT